MIIEKNKKISHFWKSRKREKRIFKSNTSETWRSKDRAWVRGQARVKLFMTNDNILKNFDTAIDFKYIWVDVSKLIKDLGVMYKKVG